MSTLCIMTCRKLNEEKKIVVTNLTKRVDCIFDIKLQMEVGTVPSGDNVAHYNQQKYKPSLFDPYL